MTNKESWVQRMLKACEENPCPGGVLTAPPDWIKSRYKEYVAQGGELSYDDWAETLTN